MSHLLAEAPGQQQEEAGWPAAINESQPRMHMDAHMNVSWCRRKTVRRQEQGSDYRVDDSMCCFVVLNDINREIEGDEAS
jgi:hypothetical protein